MFECNRLLMAISLNARRPVRALLATAGVAAGLTGCSMFTVGERGETCGNAQSAFARAMLPDTGIGAATEIQVGLTQFDPFLIGEEADVSVQHLWPSNRGVNPEPDPRVRLVRDDGRVLLDTLSTRSLPGTPNRSTWIVVQRFSNAERRNALFQAIRDSTLTVELWRRDATQPGTRARLRTTQANISPISRCL
jgi:hypothetical protein